jgi:hypothetical protein
MNGSQIAGILFLLLFVGLIIYFLRVNSQHPASYLRDIRAFSRFRRGIGLAVETGQRLHIALGHGGILYEQGGSGLVGLSLLQRIARAASASDRPPVATSGEATLMVLSQDTLKSVYRMMNADALYDPESGQLTGLTPFSYASGIVPVIYDQQVSMHVFSGHFTSEVGLIVDAAEQNNSLTFGSSDNLQGQSILFAAAQEPLIGEELYAAGAYLQVNPFHIASVRAQDIVRWGLVGVLLIGALLKAVGIL